MKPVGIISPAALCLLLAAPAVARSGDVKQGLARNASKSGAMRPLALIAMLVSGGCGFTYGTKLSPDAAPFSYKAWGGDSGVAYGNAMEKAQAHRHAFQEPERVAVNCPFYWIKPLVAAPLVGGFAVTTVQNNTVLSSGLAVSLAILLFVPNCHATVGYEHESPGGEGGGCDRGGCRPPPLGG